MMVDDCVGSKNKRLKKWPPRFVIIGQFPVIRRALLERGWIEQEEGKDFDLKWTLKTADIDFSRIQPHQIVNHYAKNKHVTTKVGLSDSS